ncbi:hypothetical protein Tco_1307532 [Tanacetum coccineum]
MNDEGGNSLSCMLDSAPLGTSFSVVMSAWLASVDCDGAEKGGSLVLTPDRVVIAKVSASGSRVSLSPIMEKIRENFSCTPYGACRAFLLSLSCGISLRA